MKASIISLHRQAVDWSRELDFYKQEIVILSKRLEEAASKNTAQDVLAQVEHFQNRFILLKEQHDILRHENNERSEQLDKLAKERPTHLDEKFLTESDSMNKKMNDFTTSFRDTRYEFNSFLSKVM